MPDIDDILLGIRILAPEDGAPEHKNAITMLTANLLAEDESQFTIEELEEINANEDAAEGFRNGEA